VIYVPTSHILFHLQKRLFSFLPYLAAIFLSPWLRLTNRINHLPFIFSALAAPPNDVHMCRRCAGALLYLEPDLTLSSCLMHMTNNTYASVDEATISELCFFKLSLQLRHTYSSATFNCLSDQMACCHWTEKEMLRIKKTKQGFAQTTASEHGWKTQGNCCYKVTQLCD
jgi:hypothetical protein